jgi:hypothetical protein|tara:strand:+ start:7097 stop:7390 length:294 start_codon:yes stop_codon:yes gene_type:complete
MRNKKDFQEPLLKDDVTMRFLAKALILASTAPTEKTREECSRIVIALGDLCTNEQVEAAAEEFRAYLERNGLWEHTNFGKKKGLFEKITYGNETHEH